jgi:hypothetical protein
VSISCLASCLAACLCVCVCGTLASNVPMEETQSSKAWSRLFSMSHTPTPTSDSTAVAVLSESCLLESTLFSLCISSSKQQMGGFWSREST